MDESFYGQQRFSFIDGVWHAIGHERHERVKPDESAAAFLDRINQIAQQRLIPAATIERRLEIARGRIVGASIVWSYPPVRAPLLAEPVVATDVRKPGWRTGRGSGRSRSDENKN